MRLLNLGNLGRSLEVAVLGSDHEARDGVRLPGRSANVLDALGVLKHGLGLLQRLAGRLGEAKEDVDESGDVEHGKDDVGPPLNVGKGRRGKETEGRVERPVGRGRERDTLAAKAEREKLGRVRPRGGTPGWGKRGDK